jgi:hypothetical protein
MQGDGVDPLPLAPKNLDNHFLFSLLRCTAASPHTPPLLQFMRERERTPATITGGVSLLCIDVDS